MEDVVLTIAERLKDLRDHHNLTLEALAKAVNISKSALGSYETGDFKDISPFSVIKLAKFYGVTTDYLMGVSNIENRADAEIHELRLTNEALNVLKSGHFSGKLLSEVICHSDFSRLMTDMEIFVDQIINMQIDNLNYSMGTARNIVQEQYHPDENELFYRAAELGTVPADEYVSFVLLDDLISILRDIRQTHPKKAKSSADISPFVVLEKFQNQVQTVVDEEGTPREQAVKVYLTLLGIDYKSLTHEEFEMLMGIWEKSTLKENSISQRGKKRPGMQRKRKK